ncbi:MAG: IS66 family insertion sequence element accessory protein TnpB [Ruminococcus sp.]|nr:IS66 family insertion sequence element accessory protein TnpB [Ruminococcus sp.]
METNSTTAITTVKQELRLNEWAAQIEAQYASGLTVQKWCAENGISPKTYYYRLRKVREQCMEAAPSIVPLSVPQSNDKIRIEKNGLQISLPADISVDILTALVYELC